MSKEAQAAIDYMMSARAARSVNISGKNPELENIKRIFDERHMVDEQAKKIPLPDKLTLDFETADGVHGEWLKYIDADKEKISDKVILFVHGGGFASGSALSRRALAGRLALAAKVDSFSIDYRQCPEYKYPAHLDDCVTAYLWLLKKGYAPNNIVLFGESAGGNLVLAMVHYLKDHYFPVPGGVCAFSPVVEMLEVYDSRVTRSNRDAMIGQVIDESEVESILEKMRNSDNSIISNYCTREEAASPYVSPIRGDFKGFPKLMLQVGTDEILYDDAIKTAQKAEAAGADVTLHEWEGMFHVFALFECPETDIVCNEIGEFIRNV